MQQEIKETKCSQRDGRVSDSSLPSPFRRVQTDSFIRQLPVDKIDPSPYQMRRVFDPAEIQQLAASIQQNGLLQPVTVRHSTGGRFILIAGERRLRACKAIGLRTIPAIICRTDSENGALLGYIENRDRKDPDCFDLANGLRLLHNLWGCSQETTAARLGLSQSAFCNKLRLLQLSEEEQCICREGKLSERHARAILGLPAGDDRTELIKLAADHKWSVSYLEQQVKHIKQRKTFQNKRCMVRDVRLFVNTVNRAVNLMNQAGIGASTFKREGDDFIEYKILIPVTEAFSKL